jgi:hypothetical protein
MFFGVFSVAIGRLLRRLSGRTIQDSLPTGPVHILDVTAYANVLGARDHTANLIHLTGLVSLAYAGIAAELVGNKVSAMVCTAAACSISGWIVERRHAWKHGLGGVHVTRLLIHSVLAIGTSFLLLLFAGRNTGHGAVGNKPAGPEDHASPRSGRYSSIILFKKRKTASLVIPSKTSTPLGPARILSKIMSIPFSGEYWFFRRPLLRPAPDSVKAEGDPTIFSVNVRGVGALQMQARQRLGRPIGIGCCHFVNLVLRADDEQPDAVRVELILVNSSRRVHNLQTLGKQSLSEPYTSVPAADGGLPDTTFRFNVPNHSEISTFDALEVWFHLDSPRAGQSAIVSIVRFDLIP